RKNRLHAGPSMNTTHADFDTAPYEHTYEGYFGKREANYHYSVYKLDDMGHRSQASLAQIKGHPVLSKIKDIVNSPLKESLIQDKIHHNASIATMKAVASANEHKLARFVIDKNEQYHVGDASRYCHGELHHEYSPYKGWIRANEDGTHSYMKWCD